MLRPYISFINDAEVEDLPKENIFTGFVIGAGYMKEAKCFQISLTILHDTLSIGIYNDKK